jgi:hypothetical protein
MTGGFMPKGRPSLIGTTCPFSGNPADHTECCLKWALIQRPVCEVLRPQVMPSSVGG